MGRTFIGNFKGPKGDTGEQGPQGIQGPQGPQGESGEIDGNSVIEYVESTDDNPPASPGVIKNILGWLIGKMKKVSAQNNDLAQRLEGKAPSSHTHTAAQVTDLTQASVKYAENANNASKALNADYATNAGSANTIAWGNVSGKPVSYPPSAHTHNDQYYTESEVNNLLGGKLNRTISGNRTTRCIQDLLNTKVITTDAAGMNAVSGLDNYLIIHHALDIRDPSNMYCFTSGFVTGGQYKLAQISNKTLSIATNTVGTVAVQGGDASFIKQIFIAIPQIGAAIL